MPNSLKKPPFKNAKIINCGGKLTARWYVHYSLLNEVTNNYKSYREYVPTSIKSYAARMVYARKLKDTINQMLLDGTIGNTPQIAPAANKYLIAALEKSLEQRYNDKFLAYGTKKITKSILTHFKAWLIAIGFEDIQVKDFTVKLAREFVNHRANDKGLKPGTINNQISLLKVLFDNLIDLDLIDNNPFALTRKLKTRENEIVLWNDEQLNVYFEYLKKNNVPMFIISLLIYQAFIRPNEISLLQVQDLNLANNLVRIKSTSAKNKKTLSVTLSAQLVELLKIHCQGFSGQHYLFSTKLMPGLKKPDRPRFHKIFQPIRKKLNLPANLKMYHLKHTGNSKLINSGVDPYKLMQQNRHHSFSMTERYIKRLEQKANPDFINLEWV